MRSRGERAIQTKIGTLSKLLAQLMSAGSTTIVAEGLHLRRLPQACLSLGEPLIKEFLGLHPVLRCPQLPLVNTAAQSKTIEL